MGLMINSGGGNFTLAPTGTHVARCYMVLDLGTQNGNFQGKPLRARKVRIGFEIPAETHVFNEDRGPEPFGISKEFTASLNEKANLRKQLESWRGRPFTPEELKGFDISKLLGATAMITVIHKPKKSDPSTMVSDIASITSLPKGSKCDPAVNDPLYYEIAHGRGGVFSKLPEWIQKTIEKAEEFNAAPPQHDGPDEGAPTDDDGDALPF